MAKILVADSTVPSGAALVLGVTSHNVPASALLTEKAQREVTSALAALAPSTKKTTITKLTVPTLENTVLLLVNLGENPTTADLRECAGAALLSEDLGSAVAIDFPHSTREEFAAIGEGALLGAYRFDEYKSEKAKRTENIYIVTSLTPTPEEISRVEILADAQNQVRDLVNTPAGNLGTTELVDATTRMAQKAGVSVRVWGDDELAANNCGGILGVGAGSARGSYLVRLEWAPEGARRHVALVGKGITFDSGGMSLKSHQGLIDMKTDMTGAATVAAVVCAAARLGLPVRVSAWMCIAENMLSGTATRLGDVLHISNGTTVEVTNTDAEGRLVLADGLVQATAEQPNEVIDVATLTGAQIVALGERCAGLMGTEKLVSEIANEAEKSGEEMWPMPLPAYLLTCLNSPIADIKNSGGRHGGMLIAGLFLKEFVGETPWAHIDIAGPSYNTGKAWGATPAGATGFAVRTLLRHLAK